MHIYCLRVLEARRPRQGVGKFSSSKAVRESVLCLSPSSQWFAGKCLKFPGWQLQCSSSASVVPWHSPLLSLYLFSSHKVTILLHQGPPFFSMTTHLQWPHFQTSSHSEVLELGLQHFFFSFFWWGGQKSTHSCFLKLIPYGTARVNF